MGLSGVFAPLPRSCSPLHSLVCMRESVPKSSIKKILKKNSKHTLKNQMSVQLNYKVNHSYPIMQNRLPIVVLRHCR